MALILVVDDTVANLRLAEFLLKRAGFDVQTAKDAVEARAAIGHTRPRLVLMDLQLPGTDGFTLTGQLKNDAATRDIPIVAMTAYAMNGDEDRAIAAGCDGYMSKPIDPGTFAERVKTFIK
jgi:CheY-like chemotaxis protein